MSTATQDSAAILHPLLATLVARLEEAGVDDALAAGAAQVRHWQKRGRTDMGEKLTVAETKLVEEAVISLAGGAHGGSKIDDETAGKVVGRSEHLAVVMEGLPRNDRAEEVARKLLETETTGDELYGLLDQGVKMHRHIARVLRRKAKPHPAKLARAQVQTPTITTDEQIAANQQIDSAGEVIVEAAPGAALTARGSRGTKPAAVAPAKGAATGGFEQIHPRGRGGKWIQKGAGQGTGGPDQAVKQLQQRLHELGFKTTQDGQFGTVTEQAVMAFQTKYGLPPTGKVDQATIETMRQPPPIDAKTARAQLAAQQGLQTKAAKQKLERDLSSVGYDSGGADTATALRRLQRQYGLTVSGKPDNATLDLIKRLQERDKRQASKKGGGQLSADQLTHAATTEDPEEGDDMPDKLEETATEEASFSSGGFDTNTPVPQPYGGILPLVTPIVPSIQPPDPADRTPGMDDFFGQEPARIPPNLREAPDGTFQRCGSCVHFNGKKLCALFSAGVDRDDLCDVWLTLSPPEQVYAAEHYGRAVGEFVMEASSVNAEKMKHARAKLEEAVEETGGGELASVVKKFTDKGMPVAAAKKAAAKALARKRVQETVGIDGLTVDDTLALVEPVLTESEWVALDEAADSMAKATVHEKVGHTEQGLWHHKGLQLPAYIQHIANDIKEKRGMDTSRAIAIAIGAVKRWARGGGKVDPGTRAAAAKALAEWEKLKATHGGKLKEALVAQPAVESRWLSYGATLPAFIERIAKHAYYEDGKLLAEALQFGFVVASRLGAAGDRDAAAAAREWGERRERIGGHTLVEGALSAQERKKLPKSAFAIPEKEAYPIHDEGHARAALTRVAQHGTPEEKKRVRAAVKSKHPKIQVAEAFDARDLAVAVAETGWAALDRPPIEVTSEQAVAILEAVKLHEAFYPTSIHFDPRLHPRGRTGEFTDVLSKLMKASHGSEATLPHGVAVRRSRGGSKLTVSQSGKKLGSFSSADKAAARALAATGIPEGYKPSYGKQTERFSVAFDPGDKHDNKSIVERALNGDHTNLRGKSLTSVSHAPNTTTIYTYKEPLAHIDHGERRMYLNVHRYSATSSAHKTLVRDAAYRKGYAIHEIDRAEAYARMGSTPSAFEKLPAGVKSGGATGPKPGTPGWESHRQSQAAAATQRAAELHAMGNHEHAKDYEEMAARFRSPSMEKSGGAERKPGIIGEKKVGKKLANGTYVEAHAKLELLGGNALPHFSVTGTHWKSEGYAKGSRADHAQLSGGQIEALDKHFPELKAVRDLHLADEQGVPMHAHANGWYAYSGEWHKHDAESQYAKPRTDTPHELAASILRVSPDRLPKDMNKTEFNAFADSLRPEWQRQADAAKKLLGIDSGEKSGGTSPAQQNVLDYLGSRGHNEFVSVPPGVSNDRRTLDALVTSGRVERDSSGRHRLAFSGDKGGGETRYGTGTTARFSRPGSHNYPNLPNGAELVGQIKAGTRVTIMSPQGQERSGKAVMRSSEGGWVLNMGGAHGTPGLVNERNIVRLGGKRKLREAAEEIVAALPALGSDTSMVSLLKADEAVLVRLPLAEVLVRHGAKIAPSLREELREALLEVAPLEESEKRLAAAREAGEASKVKLYETLVSAVS